jgi:DNA primase
LGEGNMSTAMSKTLKEESRISKIQEYGDEKLPAGDLSGDEIIVVEGRADVVNLLKNRVNNVIGMNGTKLPAEIRKLGEKKEITLFIDGDRGGKLIAKNVIQNAKVAYVAVAPDGKEVEELEGKEILMSLRKKLTLEEFMRKERMEMRREESGKKETNDINPEKAKEKIREGYECSLKGTKKIALFNENFEIMRQVGAKEAIKSINYSKENISAIAIDGTATNALIEACEQKDIAFLGATNFSSASSSKVKLISL